MALITKSKKSKGKAFTKKGNNYGEGHHLEKKKSLSKIKCFVCHKQGHYASQCPKKKKGTRKTQQVATAETQLSEFATKFENDFSLVACLSTSTIVRSAWYLDSGASCHMAEA